MFYRKYPPFFPHCFEDSFRLFIFSMNLMSLKKKSSEVLTRKKKNLDTYVEGCVTKCILSCVPRDIQSLHLILLVFKLRLISF